MVLRALEMNYSYGKLHVAVVMMITKKGEDGFSLRAARFFISLLARTRCFYCPFARDIGTRQMVF